MVKYKSSIKYILTKSNLAVSLNSFHALIEAELAAVEAEVVVHGVGPLLAGVVLVVDCAELVLLGHELYKLIVRKALYLGCLFLEEWLWRMDKDAEDVVVVLKDEVCTSSDNDTAGGFCKSLDNLGLVVEKIGLGCKLLAVRADEFALIYVYRSLEKSGISYSLVCIEEKSKANAALLRSKMNKLMVVIMYSKIIGQHLADGSSAATVLTRNCDDDIPLHPSNPSILN